MDKKARRICDGLFYPAFRRTGCEYMSCSSLRTFTTAFFLTLVIFGTIAGLTVAAFNTQSAITPMDTPASVRIAENGSSYEFSFFDRRFHLPRPPVQEVENLLNRYPVLIPKSILFFAYGADILSDYLP